MTDAACAHLKVEYKPEELGPSTFRDRWLCCNCGARFVIEAVAEYRMAEMLKRKAELQKDFEATLLDRNELLARYQQVTASNLNLQGECDRLLGVLTSLEKQALEYADDCWRKYKRGKGPARGDTYYQGLSDGAEETARIIRAEIDAAKESNESHS